MAEYAADIETTGLLHQMLLQEKPLLHNMGFKDIQTGHEILFSNQFETLDLSKKQYKGIDVKPLSSLQSFLHSGHKLYMHNGMLFDGEALRFLHYDEIAQKVSLLLDENSVHNMNEMLMQLSHDEQLTQEQRFKLQQSLREAIFVHHNQ